MSTLVLLAIGISCVALGDTHNHLLPLAQFGINAILYAILLMAGAGWCYTMEPVIRRYVHVAGGLIGFLSIGWTWGLYEGRFVPENPVLFGLAFIHVAVAFVFIRPIAVTIVSVRDNWEVAFKNARTRAGQGKSMKSLTLAVVAIYALPFISAIK